MSVAPGQILEVRWFTSALGCVGIVLVETRGGSGARAYIGQATLGSVVEIGELLSGDAVMLFRNLHVASRVMLESTDKATLLEADALRIANLGARIHDRKVLAAFFPEVTHWCEQ